MRVERGFNHEHLRGHRVDSGSRHSFLHLCSTPAPLPPTHSLVSPPLTLSIPSLFPPASNSTLSSNLHLLPPLPPHSTLPSCSCFLHSLTLLSFLLPSTLPLLPPFIQAFIEPQHISSFASTFPRSCRFIIPLPLLSLAPLALSAPLYHGPQSIPPFHSCQLSEPQEP